jgi:hypothetical protein
MHIRNCLKRHFNRKYDNGSSAISVTIRFLPMFLKDLTNKELILGSEDEMRLLIA